LAALFVLPLLGSIGPTLDADAIDPPLAAPEPWINCAPLAGVVSAHNLPEKQVAAEISKLNHVRCA